MPLEHFVAIKTPPQIGETPYQEDKFLRESKDNSAPSWESKQTQYKLR